MKFEKFFNGKIFAIFELLYRLIILNIITVLVTVLGIGIFSFMPALVALIIVVRSINHDTDFPLVSTYYNAFKDNYKRVIKLSIFYLVLGLLCLFNTAFFYSAMKEYQGVINIIVFYLTLILDVIFILSFIKACFITVYFPNLNNKKVIKYSFVLLRISILKEFIIFIMFMGVLYFIYIAPIIVILVLISLFIFIINLMIKDTYLRLVADGVKSLDAFSYIKKSKI